MKEIDPAGGGGGGGRRRSPPGSANVDRRTKIIILVKGDPLLCNNKSSVTSYALEIRADSGFPIGDPNL